MSRDSIPIYPTSADEIGDAVKAYAQLGIEDGFVDEAAAVAALRTAADELEGETDSEEGGQ